QVDPLQTQTAQAAFHFFAQSLRASVRVPASGTGAIQSAFCRDHQAGRVGTQRLGDDLFADVRAVRLRGVNEIDAELDRAAQHGNALLAIFRRSPDAVAGQAHCAETETLHGEISAQLERAALSGADRF